MIMNNIMMDIETLSTDSNGVIVSISAVQFSMADGELGAEFETGLKLNQQIDKGAIMDPDTVVWWLGQPKEAQTMLLGLDARDVSVALEDFNRWLTILYPTWAEQKDVKLWGNGSNFDNVLVRNLYKRHGVKFILPYWCDNDVRTLVSYLNIDTRDYTFVGTKHYGIDDCKHQINYCTGGLKNGVKN